MRYRDASHVDVGGFYARRPRQGSWYRAIGLIALACESILIASGRGPCMACLLIALVLVWLLAWYQVVGTLWRSNVVSAILVAAVYLSWMHVGNGLCQAFCRCMS
jgi:hypothetical protein